MKNIFGWATNESRQIYRRRYQANIAPVTAYVYATLHVYILFIDTIAIFYYPHPCNSCAEFLKDSRINKWSYAEPIFGKLLIFKNLMYLIINVPVTCGDEMVIISRLDVNKTQDK